MIIEGSANKTKYLKPKRPVSLVEAVTKLTLWADSGADTRFLREVFSAFAGGGKISVYKKVGSRKPIIIYENPGR